MHCTITVETYMPFSIFIRLNDVMDLICITNTCFGRVDTSKQQRYNRLLFNVYDSSTQSLSTVYTLTCHQVRQHLISFRIRMFFKRIIADTAAQFVLWRCWWLSRYKLFGSSLNGGHCGHHIHLYDIQCAIVSLYKPFWSSPQQEEVEEESTELRSTVIFCCWRTREQGRNRHPRRYDTLEDVDNIKILSSSSFFFSFFSPNHSFL